jgi:formylglycine-generating enzyme required for sulfatase activity
MRPKLIPAGEFVMGSPESSRDRDEKPQHKVRSTQLFYLGVTEVTHEQYDEVTGKIEGRYGEGATYPATWVSWD